MLARVAADFYWMGRYIERTEHTARLLRHQLTQLPDHTAVDLARSWQVVYQALGQSPPGIPEENPDELETYFMVDAYTLTGVLVEEQSNSGSMLSCWGRARENAREVRPHLPLSVWVCLNQGHLWMQKIDFAQEWSDAPLSLVSQAHDRLRLIAGVVESDMARDDGWRFLELGRFLERLQNQASLLEAWKESSVSRDDLLRVCAAYEVYCRRHSMEIHEQEVLNLLIRNPELPYSLRFAVGRIDQALTGIDPSGARYPLAAPHRMALRLMAAVEVAAMEEITKDARALHGLIQSAYIEELVT